MGYVHVEEPLALGRPPTGRHEQGGFVGEINLDGSSRDRGRHDAAAVPKVEPYRAECLYDAVHAELETVGIRHTAEVRFVGDTVFTHARRDGGIEAHAGVKRGCNGRLARLDFQAVSVAQNDELAGALEVVVDTLDGG